MAKHIAAPPLFTYLCFSILAGRAYSNAYFGTGSGPIFLDDVQCSSSSSQLLECSSRPILSHNCLHSADAGVGCEGVFYCKANPNLIKDFLKLHILELGMLLSCNQFSREVTTGQCLAGVLWHYLVCMH